jgi:hypothetical protein
MRFMKRVFELPLFVFIAAGLVIGLIVIGCENLISGYVVANAPCTVGHRVDGICLAPKDPAASPALPSGYASAPAPTAAAEAVPQFIPSTTGGLNALVVVSASYRVTSGYQFSEFAELSGVSIDGVSGVGYVTFKLTDDAFQRYLRVMKEYRTLGLPLVNEPLHLSEIAIEQVADLKKIKAMEIAANGGKLPSQTIYQIRAIPKPEVEAPTAENPGTKI